MLVVACFLFTNIWVEDLLHHQLKELFGNTSFINTLLSFKLHIQLLLQVCRILHRNHFQLQKHKKN